MVDFQTWVGVVNEAYVDMGGTYGTGPSGDTNIAAAILRAASDWWQENKETIIELAVDGARRLAEELINEWLASHSGSFPEDYR